MAENTGTTKTKLAEQEEYQKKLAEHRNRKDESFSEKMLDSNQHVRVIGGLVISEEITTEVKCDLPQYADRSVFFRTNNPAERFFKQPKLIYSPEYHSMRERALAILNEVVKSSEDNPIATPPAEYWELERQAEELRSKEYDEFLVKQCAWMSLFVKRISPWNYGRIVGYDALNPEEPIVEAIPAPNPAKPETYMTLFKEHQTLGEWCINTGYDEAVLKASRPFSRDSGKPS